MHILTTLSENTGFFARLKNILQSITFIDMLDIIVVSLVIYFIMRLVRDTRAVQILKGFAFIAVAYAVVNILGLKTMKFFLNSLLTAGLITVVVVFQPELRSGLEQMGRLNFSIFNFSSRNSDEEEKQLARTIGIISTAAISLSAEKIGALIIIEQKTRLGDIAKTGTIVDANLSPELLGSLFYPNSPLHDGAVIISENKIRAAGCYLPLSSNMDIGRELGTRHRAGLGMSENSDAVVLIVSEETGDITIAHNGNLFRKIPNNKINEELKKHIISESRIEKEKNKEEKEKTKYAKKEAREKKNSNIDMKSKKEEDVKVE